MAAVSAGVLAYRRRSSGIEVLLVHPGGPFWRNKDDGAWSIPKGELDHEEALNLAAIREFAEELGPAAVPMPPPPDGLIELGSVRQAGGKVVHAFAVEMDIDTGSVESNLVAIPWPPRSGRSLGVPEIDRAEWFDCDTARVKINRAQAAFIDRLLGRHEVSGT